VRQLREEAVGHLEGLLTDKLEEVAILQEQLALLSKHHVRDNHMMDPYGDMGKYTGHVHNEKPNGKGTMKYDDGRNYSGESSITVLGTVWIFHLSSLHCMDVQVDREGKSKMRLPHWTRNFRLTYSLFILSFSRRME
jgi:hypothetical protein